MSTPRSKTGFLRIAEGHVAPARFYYSYGQGWEDVTAEESSKEARENERGVPFRLIRRRERIAAAA